MFNTFCGNQEIKDTIKNAVKSKRFPHAIIIEGEIGSGRHTLARLIAAAAICQDQDAPCGVCRTCDLILKDGHCDVLTYSPEGATFKVDMVREIRSNAYIMPIEATRKINILTDCEKMGESAQNAFLKVLEEPPEYMVFILLCQSASALLPTVRSRCVTLTVQNPDQNDAFLFIKNKTDKSDEDILEALNLSHGNIGNALDILSGNVDRAAENAKAFFDAVKSHDRLVALSVLFNYEKDRLGYPLFLRELRLLLSEKITLFAKGEDMTISPKMLKSTLLAVTKQEQKLLKHIGQPLSLPLLQTSLVADVFVNL